MGRAPCRGFPDTADSFNPQPEERRGQSGSRGLETGLSPFLVLSKSNLADLGQNLGRNETRFSPRLVGIRQLYRASNGPSSVVRTRIIQWLPRQTASPSSSATALWTPPAATTSPRPSLRPSPKHLTTLKARASASRSASHGTWLLIRKQAQIKLATWPRKICQPFTPGSPAHDSMSLGLPLSGARGYCPYCPKSL